MNLRLALLALAAALTAGRAPAQVSPFTVTVGRAAHCASRSALALAGVRLGEPAGPVLRRLSARTGERVGGLYLSEDPAPGLVHYLYRDVRVSVADRGAGPKVEMLSAGTQRAATPSGLRLWMPRADVRRIVGPVDSGPPAPELLVVRSCDRDALVLIGFDGRERVNALQIQVVYPRPVPGRRRRRSGAPRRLPMSR